mgnify:CR=1 FL=1
MLRNDWEIVRNYLQEIYNLYPNSNERLHHLEGFTHKLRPNLLLIELVPGFKKKATGSYQKPRYRLKRTFVDYIVRGHFEKNRIDYYDCLSRVREKNDILTWILFFLNGVIVTAQDAKNKFHQVVQLVKEYENILNTSVKGSWENKSKILNAFYKLRLTSTFFVVVFLFFFIFSNLSFQSVG